MCKEYYVKRVNALSGEPDWTRAEAAPIDRYLWLPKTDIYGTARLLYDAKAIYVRLEAAEQNIRSVYQGNYDMVCEDSCLEFFLCPAAGDRRYFNMEVNPNGAYYLGFGFNNSDNIRLTVADGRKLFGMKTLVSPGGWAVEYKIPLTFLKTFFPFLRLKKGLELRGNFYKCGDLTQTPHYIAWNEVKCEFPDFHNPDYFGKLIFA